MAEKAAIILAAGVSSRMKTEMPKVLHQVCGRSMLSYVLDSCRAVGVTKIFVVVGYGAEQVKEQFGSDSDITFVLQAQQKGTGHAVLCCKDQLGDFEGDTFVICGDMPLVRSDILQSLLDRQDKSGAVVTLATAILEDPSSYGRINRDSEGNLLGIIEDKDCSEEQLEIKEVNPSYYLFDNKVLFETLAKVGNDNAKGEYYITDSISILLGEGKEIEAVTSVEPAEAMGVNSRVDLSAISKVMRERILGKLMSEGVTIIDPENTWVDSRAQIGKDTVIEPFTYIGNAKVGVGCRVGPFAYLKDGSVLDDGIATRPGSFAG